MKNISGLLLVGCSAFALSGCGPSDIASPGTGGNVIITPTPAPTPGPTPTPGTGLVTPAAACPSITGVTNGGTIVGPTGEWRICNLPQVVSASITLTKVPGVLYRLPGRVDVGCDGGFTAPTAGFTTTTVGCPNAQLSADTNVTLTIQPGVIVYAAQGASWLAVNRGNRLIANGSATQPIIFTSESNVNGTATEETDGQWGGVVLMGRGPVTDCTVGSVAANTCERQTEGSANLARFGGTDTAYNAGSMKYVQIRYSGFVLGSNTELQSLTGEGIGTGTTLDHIMSYNSSDDGSEFFGGNVNMKYYIAVGADDDSLDADTGAQMNVQYAIIAQRPGKGDSFLELDSNNNEGDTPRTTFNLANFTFIKQPGAQNNDANNQASMFFRGNSDSRLVNGVVSASDNECLRMNGSGTTPATFLARSVVMQCNATKYIGSGSLAVGAVQTSFGAGANNNRDDFTVTLQNTFRNGANEAGVTAVDPKTVFTTAAAFFDTTNYVGAAKDETAANAWWTGWTCNGAVANFGTGNSGACTSLPTT